MSGTGRSGRRGGEVGPSACRDRARTPDASAKGAREAGPVKAAEAEVRLRPASVLDGRAALRSDVLRVATLRR
jgi:hypothetical protein